MRSSWWREYVESNEEHCPYIYQETIPFPCTCKSPIICERKFSQFSPQLQVTPLDILHQQLHFHIPCYLLQTLCQVTGTSHSIHLTSLSTNVKPSSHPSVTSTVSKQQNHYSKAALNQPQTGPSTLDLYLSQRESHEQRALRYDTLRNQVDMRKQLRKWDIAWGAASSR
jgi:hypothetical protein